MVKLITLCPVFFGTMIAWCPCTQLLGVSISEIATGTNPGLVTLSDALNTGAGGLSGLTYDSANNRFVAVDDSDTRVFPVELACRVRYFEQIPRLTLGGVALTQRGTFRQHLAAANTENAVSRMGQTIVRKAIWSLKRTE
jgi:hypothetical protein